MASNDEPTSDDSRLRGNVLTAIILSGLAALGTMLNRGCSASYVATQTPVPTDAVDTAVVVFGFGFALAAIPMAIYGMSETPKTTKAYQVAFAIALIVCCGRSPVTIIPTPLDYVNWPRLLCFTIPSGGTLAAGTMARYVIARIRPKGG